MSNAVDVPAAASSAPWRRAVAGLVGSGYGYFLFALWCMPISVPVVKTIEQSPALGWSVVGLTYLLLFGGMASLPRAYFVVRSWECDGRIYQRLGVRKFRYFAGLGDGVAKLARRVDPQWQNPLARMDREQRLTWTRTVEAFRWGCMYASAPLLALAFYNGYQVLGWIYVLLNIPFNLYPIMLQRYTRAKLLRIEEQRIRLQSPANAERAAEVSRS